jgi:hypothetical protein
VVTQHIKCFQIKRARSTFVLVHSVGFTIKKEGKHIAEKFALNYIESIGIGLDFTARDLQEKCISVTSKNDKDEDKCMTMEADELGIQNKLLKDVLNEFDEKYKLSKDEFEAVIQEEFQYYMSILGVLTSMEYNNLLKYNNQKYKLGAGFDDDAPIRPISPYASLLNLILGQSDFGKKQNDIIRFVNAYARDPKTDSFGPLNERENEHWLYCKKSNVPLIPIFKYDLAGYFVNHFKRKHGT